MNHRAPRCVSVAVLSLLVGTLACGGDGSEEAPNSGEPVEDPYGGEEPTTAVTLPFEDPTPMPTPVTAPLPEQVVPATGPAQLVLLHTHELLRSEERYVEQLLSALRRASITLERTPVGDRAAMLEGWLTETDPARRAQLALGPARGSARGLLVLRISAPVDRRAQGVTAFGVIAGEPARERLWAQGDLPADAHAALAALLGEGSQP
jgi:hypothetical protein